MELAPLSEALKNFGPYGVCLLLMGCGLIYLMRWLREERKQTDVEHEGIRNQFLAALKDQRTETIAAMRDQREEHSSSLREVTADFRNAMNDHGKRIDQLSQKIDGIDGHVQELRIIRHDAHS